MANKITFEHLETCIKRGWTVMPDITVYPTNDPGTIKSWLERFPGAAWGVVNGRASGFWALDYLTANPKTCSRSFVKMPPGVTIRNHMIMDLKVSEDPVVYLGVHKDGGLIIINPDDEHWLERSLPRSQPPEPREDFLQMILKEQERQDEECAFQERMDLEEEKAWKAKEAKHGK